MCRFMRNSEALIQEHQLEEIMSIQSSKRTLFVVVEVHGGGISHDDIKGGGGG